MAVRKKLMVEGLISDMKHVPFVTRQLFLFDDLVIEAKKTKQDALLAKRVYRIAQNAEFITEGEPFHPSPPPKPQLT